MRNLNEKLKIKILKGVLNKDELGKPFIEYITEVSYNSQIWRANRKFNQFANLHKSLINLMGEDFKFPDSSNIFVKLVENNNFHENKIKQLEAYIREISDIPDIVNSKIFRKFFDFHCNTEENHFEENFDSTDNFNHLRQSYKNTNFIKSGYRSYDSDSNNENTKINNLNSNSYRNNSNYSSQRNHFYPDSEGKITFENNKYC